MDEVVIAAYDPAWPEVFAGEAQAIRQALGDTLVAIEHVGSTAVPGLAAKPIVDIMVGVHSLENAKAAIPELESFGCSYWREDTIPARLYFVKGLPPNGPRSHHIHFVERQSEFWRTHLLFRDYLRTHSEAAQNYAALKRDLALQYRDDREAYTDAKAAFIQAALDKANHA